ncbi:MAG: preprotein translocase subunit YajC [Microbacterium sp.]
MSDLLLPVVLIVMLGFMFWSSRRNNKRRKAEQEAKARAMVPGVKVLLQGGLYGTLVEYDGEDLSKSARVCLAPGVEVEVHSQAIVRVVEEEEDAVIDEEGLGSDSDEASDLFGEVESTTLDTEPRDKPQA